MAELDDDIRSAAALADHHSFFRRLREHDPVHYSASSRAWIVTGYAEVEAAFKDERLSSDRLSPLEARLGSDEREAMAETFELLRGWMVFRDPPAHGPLREPVRRAFTPRSVARLEDRIHAIVDELLDEMRSSPTCELISQFAFPLPAIVIAELLGVPADDRERFKRSSRKLSGLVFGAVERAGRDRSAGEGAGEFARYFRELIARYEREPGDNLVSALIAARDRGDGLSAEQLVGACTMLLFGGHETTTTLIGNAMATLLAHPEQCERLGADRSLDAAAVEEFLRYEGPAKVMVRHVREPTELGGHALEPGQRVYLSVAGANRDPAVFAEPDRFDVARAPNPHLGFGHGLHFCLGAALARAEAAIAVRGLIERYPAMRLADQGPQWVATIIGRGPVSLPVTL